MRPKPEPLTNTAQSVVALSGSLRFKRGLAPPAPQQKPLEACNANPVTTLAFRPNLAGGAKRRRRWLCVLLLGTSAGDAERVQVAEGQNGHNQDLCAARWQCRGGAPLGASRHRVAAFPQAGTQPPPASHIPDQYQADSCR